MVKVGKSATEKPLMVRHFSPKQLAAQRFDRLMKSCECKSGLLLDGVRQAFKSTEVLADPAAARHLNRKAKTFLARQAAGSEVIPNLKVTFGDHPLLILQHGIKFTGLISNQRTIKIVLGILGQVINGPSQKEIDVRWVREKEEGRDGERTILTDLNRMEQGGMISDSRGRLVDRAILGELRPGLVDTNPQKKPNIES